MVQELSALSKVSSEGLQEKMVFNWSYRTGRSELE